MTLDVMDRLLPIVTLLIGALLTFLLQRAEGGYARRLAAGDLLAELRRHVWSQGEPDGWVSFQVYLGRLRIYLREAGVPERVTRSLSTTAEQFWSAVEETDHGPVMPDEHIAGALDIAENRVHMFLRTGLANRILEWRDRREVVQWVTEEQEEALRSRRRS